MLYLCLGDFLERRETGGVRVRDSLGTTRCCGCKKKCHLRRHGESEVEHKTEIKHNNIIMEGEENDETRGTGRALEGV